MYAYAYVLIYELHFITIMTHPPMYTHTHTRTQPAGRFVAKGTQGVQPWGQPIPIIHTLAGAGRSCRGKIRGSLRIGPCPPCQVATNSMRL